MRELANIGESRRSVLRDEEHDGKEKTPSLKPHGSIRFFCRREEFCSAKELGIGFSVKTGKLGIMSDWSSLPYCPVGIQMPINGSFPRPSRHEMLRYRMRLALIVGWVLLMVLPPLVLRSLRGNWLTELDHPAVQEQWDHFRQDMRQQSDRSGPVQHKVPKSVEPPLRVWLRDYFWLAVTAWGVLGSALYAFLAMALIGVMDSVAEPAADPTSRESASL